MGWSQCARRGETKSKYFAMDYKKSEKKTNHRSGKPQFFLNYLRHTITILLNVEANLLLFSSPKNSIRHSQYSMASACHKHAHSGVITVPSLQASVKGFLSFPTSTWTIPSLAHLIALAASSSMETLDFPFCPTPKMPFGAGSLRTYIAPAHL